MAAAPTRRHSLPLQLTSFVGREAELAAVARLLGEHEVLVIAEATAERHVASRTAADLSVDVSMGYWLPTGAAPAVRPLSYAELPTRGQAIEYVDGRIAPALLSSYATLTTIGEVPEYLDGRPTGAAARSYADLPTLAGPTGPGGE